jgi:tetratricopeptide (TPR) repeat protein
MDQSLSTPLSQQDLHGQRNLRLIVLYFFVLLPVAYIYWPCFSFPFVNWDDPSYVTNRTEIQHGLSWAGIQWAFTSRENANWHPLTWLSYMLETQFFGVKSEVMHATNLFLHVLNTLLVGVVAYQLSRKHAAGVVTALLFGIHPQHVEVVAWVSERKELLCTFFGLLSLVVQLQDSGRQPPGRAIAAILLYACSLASKQMLVTLPFLVVTLRVAGAVSRGEPWRPALKDTTLKQVPYFLLTLLAIFAAVIGQSSGKAIQQTDSFPIWCRIANAFQSVVFYFFQTIVPVWLSPFYEHLQAQTSISLSLLCAAVLIALLGLVFRYRSVPFLVVSALWFLGTLFPVIGLVQLGSAARADRYMYFPHIGLFIAFSEVFLRVLQGYFRPYLVLVLVIVLAFVQLSRQQVHIWSDSIPLWQKCIAVEPNNFLGHEQLALAFLTAERLDEAVASGRKAIQCQKSVERGTPYTYLGSALLFRGDRDEAIPILREAIRQTPNDFRAMVNLGYALHDLDLVEARDLFRQALLHSPGNTEAMGNLANCEAELGNLEEAVSLLKQAVAVNPKDVRLQSNLTMFQNAIKERR